MISFAEQVAYDFDSAVDLTWNVESLDRVTVRFTIESIANVRVSFEQREAKWDFGFEVQQLTAGALAYGGSFRLFNGVFQAAQEFTAVHEPETVVLVAKQESLADIYATYLRKNASEIEALGYRIEGPVRVDPFSEFILTRIV